MNDFDEAQILKINDQMEIMNSHLNDPDKVKQRHVAASISALSQERLIIQQGRYNLLSQITRAVVAVIGALRGAPAATGTPIYAAPISNLVQRALDATATIFIAAVTKKGSGMYGNAVAVSPRLLLTALHGKVAKGSKVSVTTRKGVQFTARVVFVQFDPDLVDIALLEVDGPLDLQVFVPVSDQPVQLLDPIALIGLRMNSVGNHEPCSVTSTVNLLESEPGSALFQTTYTAFDGLSGAGVILKVTRKVSWIWGTVTDEIRVVGVHVASHDTTEPPPALVSTGGTAIAKSKKTKSTAAATPGATPAIEGSASTAVAKKKGHRGQASDAPVLVQDIAAPTLDSVALALSSLSSSIHGHTAYCLVCEPARVPALLKLLKQHGALP